MVAVMLGEAGACVQRVARRVARSHLEVGAGSTLRGSSGQGGGDRSGQAGAPVPGMKLDRSQPAPAVRHSDPADGDDPAVAADAGERLERSRHQQLPGNRRQLLPPVVTVVQPRLGGLGM